MQLPATWHRLPQHLLPSSMYHVPYLVHRVTVSFGEVDDIVKVLLDDKAGSVTWKQKRHQARRVSGLLT